MRVAAYIEHTLLRPDTTIGDIRTLCEEAVGNRFAAVCVPPILVKQAKEMITGSTVQLATVIGYPYGYNAIESKVAEAVLAVVDNADELDVMINLVALKSGDWQYLAKEISTLSSITRKAGKKIKVMIEASLLNDEEIITCCDIYGAAGVDFIQTSSMVLPNAVTLPKIKLIRSHLADAVHVKAAETVNSLTAIKELIDSGVQRIVCHNPMDIIKEEALKNAGMIFENQKH